MQTGGDVTGLMKALDYPDAQVRRRAAAALRVVGATDAIPRLRDVLDTEQNTDARLAITAALEYLEGQVEATDATDTDAQADPDDDGPNRPLQSRFERLIQHLMGSRPDMSVQAANALAELDDQQAVTPLIQVFRNPKRPPQVRLAAAEALLALDSATPAVTLLGALRSEKWHLRRNGAAILGRMQAEWAVEPLSRALYDPNELVARTAKAALRKIGTQAAEEALEDARFAMVDTDQATDPQIEAKAQRAKRIQQHEQDKTASRTTNNLDPNTLKDYLKSQRKPDTARLKPPAKKSGTGSLKDPVKSTDETRPVYPTTTTEAPQPSPADNPPQPPASEADSTQTPKRRQRKPSRRRKSATERLTPPDDDTDETSV